MERETIMIYFENDAAIIFVLPEKNLAVTKWKGFASTEELRKLLDEALNLLENYTIHYWLNDNRLMKVVRPADQEFVVNEWLPKYLQKSVIKKSVTIESEDIFSKMSSESMLRQADKMIPFDMATFKTYKEAISWLGVELDEKQIAKLAA